MSITQPSIQTSLDPYLRKSWFHRNWRWFVPSLILFAFVCIGLTVFTLVEYSFRHAEPFQIAMKEAQHSPKVVSVVGETMKNGLFVKGSIQISGARGWAHLAIPISGERGKGTVFIEATRRAGRWEPHLLTFEAETGERIDLLKPPST
jgi:Cytochrome oxidase complex assembly protein 1